MSVLEAVGREMILVSDLVFRECLPSSYTRPGKNCPSRKAHCVFWKQILNNLRGRTVPCQLLLDYPGEQNRLAVLIQ